MKPSIKISPLAPNRVRRTTLGMFIVSCGIAGVAGCGVATSESGETANVNEGLASDFLCTSQYDNAYAYVDDVHAVAESFAAGSLGGGTVRTIGSESAMPQDDGTVVVFSTRDYTINPKHGRIISETDSEDLSVHTATCAGLSPADRDAWRFVNDLATELHLFNYELNKFAYADNAPTSTKNRVGYMLVELSDVDPEESGTVLGTMATMDAASLDAMVAANDPALAPTQLSTSLVEQLSERLRFSFDPLGECVGSCMEKADAAAELSANDVLMELARAAAKGTADLQITVRKTNELAGAFNGYIDRDYEVFGYSYLQLQLVGSTPTFALVQLKSL